MAQRRRGGVEGAWSFAIGGRIGGFDDPFRVGFNSRALSGGVAAPRWGCAPPPAIDDEPFGLAPTDAARRRHGVRRDHPDLSFAALCASSATSAFCFAAFCLSVLR
jgi:hypothetical protein